MAYQSPEFRDAQAYKVAREKDAATAYRNRLINDRRNAVGSGDFNNPSGSFSVGSPSSEDEFRWRGLSAAEAKPEVLAHFQGQKDTQTWAEANRLAKRRTENMMRSDAKKGLPELRGDQLAGFYQTHLTNVMHEKGEALADGYGELHHRQSGYGRV